jgi:flavin-dependent dehydrogenase
METFGARIHAFLPKETRIEFGAVTPKGNHLTINIAGPSVDSTVMQEFLQLSEVRQVLPNLDQAGQVVTNDLRSFKGRFPVSLARGTFGDRWVMIGDAAGLVRAFKGKGVTSALQTGIRAAETMLRVGISAQAFRRDYLPANRDLLRDIPFGRAMRLSAIGLARMGLFDMILEAGRREPRLYEALFDAVSAHGPYRRVWANGLSRRSLAAILRATVGDLLGSSAKAPVPDEGSSLRHLH